ncbi:MAG: cytochrome c [Myxococcales bacterium FL481]|nr:MAG: cytochrome c [Myxococcales bacterium FL481]
MALPAFIPVSGEDSRPLTEPATKRRHEISTMPVRIHLPSATALALALSACGPTTGAPASGEELYDACENCHGSDGAGNPDIEAPQIAGLPQWYIEAQLHKFRSGARGAHPDDAPGMRMRPLSMSMPNDESVTAVARYVSRLPRQGNHEPKVAGGSATRGSGYYAPCVTCHGASGQGNPALNAPPLAGSPDWYLTAQLRKFIDGVRGGDAAADPTGAQMRAMAVTLPNDQAIKDVVAHIMTFEP